MWSAECICGSDHHWLLHAGDDWLRTSQDCEGIQPSLCLHLTNIDVRSMNDFSIWAVLRNLFKTYLSSPACPSRISLNFFLFTDLLALPDDLRLWLGLQAGTSAFKNIPVIIMSSEDDSNRIKRYIPFTAHSFEGYHLDFIPVEMQQRLIFGGSCTWLGSCPDLWLRLSRSCLAEGAKEFIIKPVQMKDVKRLQGHIMTSASSSESNESSISSSCAKRKAPDGLQANSPVRRTRYGGVAVVSWDLSWPPLFIFLHLGLLWDWDWNSMSWSKFRSLQQTRINWRISGELKFFLWKVSRTYVVRLWIW